MLSIPLQMMAAGGSPLDLVMPDARVLVGVRVDRILASPVGAQIMAEMEKSSPGMASQIKMATGMDITQDLHEIIVATTAQAGKNPPTLVIVRGSFHPERFAGLAAFGAKVTRLDGVPVLTGGPKGAMAAFLDESTMVAGEQAQVRAAILRRNRGGRAPVAVADRVRDYGQRFDAWIVSVGSLPSWKSAGTPVLQAGGIDASALQGIEQLHGGIRVSPDFELAVELLARTEKEAGELSGAIAMLHGMLQAKRAGSAASEWNGLEKLKFGAEGRRVVVSLALSQEDVQKAMQTRMRAGRPEGPPQDRAAKATAPPPPLAIRVQTSATDIRTIVIPPPPNER
jgi:hypothetical protein